MTNNNIQRDVLITDFIMLFINSTCMHTCGTNNNNYY